MSTTGSADEGLKPLLHAAKQRAMVYMTMILFAGGAGLIGWSQWRERRPPSNFDVSLLPTAPMLFLGIVLIILGLASGIADLGIDLPRRF